VNFQCELLWVVMAVMVMRDVLVLVSRFPRHEGTLVGEETTSVASSSVFDFQTEHCHFWMVLLRGDREKSSEIGLNAMFRSPEFDGHISTVSG